MINSNSFPIIKIELPAIAGQIYLVPVESDQLTPIIVPVLSAMPEMKEGALNVESATPIIVEEGAVQPREAAEKGKKAVASEQMLIDVPVFISKSVSKERVEWVAKHIAKDVIPEKMATPSNHSNLNLPTKPPMQASKDDKAAVDQARKDPENSNLSVPKESVKRGADQPTFKRPDISKNIPMKPESINKNDTFQSAEQPREENAQTHESNIGEKILPQAKGKAEDTKICHKNPENSKVNTQENVPLTTTKENLADKTEYSSLPKKHEDSPLPTVNMRLSPNHAPPMAEPAKKAPENPVIDARKTKEVEADKVIKPRKDVIPATEKNDNAVPVVNPHRPADDSQVAKVPFMLDFPLSRDSIYRQANTQKHVRFRQDQGFRLDDLLLMIFSAVLCGAKNTLGICRYLQSQERFFKAWMGIKHSMPSYRVIWFLLNKLDPKMFRLLLKKILTKDSSKQMQLIHVWESPRGIVLGEISPSSKQGLLVDALEIFDLQGALVNIEQKELNQSAAQKVKRSGGEFLVALSGSLKDQAHESLKRASNQHRDVIKEGAATVLRETWVSDDVTWFTEKNEWPDLKTTVKLNSESIQGERLLYETRLYLSSLALSADKMSQALRIFSLIEAQVNWLIDIDFFTLELGSFREHEAANIEIMEMICQEHLANIPGSAAAHRKKAKEDTAHLRRLLN